MNQINHPNILFSYGLIYPENYKKLDLKNLERYLPKRKNKQLMSSVDKLMKKNKYGERQFPRFDKNRSPLMKHYGDMNGVMGKNRVKMSVSPNPLRPVIRKKFNFSKTFKDFELEKSIKDEDINEMYKDEENIKDKRNLNKYVSNPKYGNKKKRLNNLDSKTDKKDKYRVSLKRNRKHKSVEPKINLCPKHLVNLPF